MGSVANTTTDLQFLHRQRRNRQTNLPAAPVKSEQQTSSLAYSRITAKRRPLEESADLSVSSGYYYYY